jgi:signal transduction histidine kinase
MNRPPGEPSSGAPQEQHVEPPPHISLRPHLRLDDLLSELHTRLQAVLNTRDRVEALLEAVVAVGSELELEAVLRRVVEAAAGLVDARYGALGVLGEHGQLTDFITVGVSEAEMAAMSGWPQGHGLLAELMADHQPLRTPDIAAHPRSCGFPAGHPPMRSFLGAPVQVRGAAYGNLYLADKHGGEPFDEDDQALVVALAAAAGAAVDKARLYAEARRQQQWLQASGEVTRRLLLDDSPEQILTLITELAREMAGADLVCLALPAGADHLMIRQASGTGADRVLGLVLPLEDSVSGIVLRTGEPVAVDDYGTDPRVPELARERGGLGQAVVFPLGGAGNVRGALTVGRRPGSPPLTAAAIEMVGAFTAQAAIGLELADRRRDAARAALYADRDRIARDLHDLVIQRLFATGMSLQAATGLIPDGPAAERVRQSVDALDDSIRDIRASIYTLQAHPEPDKVSLRGQIMAVADEMTAALGYAPSLHLGSRLDAAVPPEIGADLLVALREGLANAARHAKATRVDVTAEAGEELLLVVADNGAGLSGTGRRSGVANLAARARARNGDLRLEPAEGGGTRMEWRVPLAAPG